MSESDSLRVESVQKRESKLLASWAIHSVDSAGRAHPEIEHLFRVINLLLVVFDFFAGNLDSDSLRGDLLINILHLMAGGVGLVNAILQLS